MILRGECSEFNPLLMDCLREVEGVLNTEIFTQSRERKITHSGLIKELLQGEIFLRRSVPCTCWIRNGWNIEQFITELQAAMEKKETYSAMCTIEGSAARCTAPPCPRRTGI